MEIRGKKLPGVYEIMSEPFKDIRGFLLRTFDQYEFEKAGINMHWLQESHSHTIKRYTLRGLHVSLPPYVEGKIITPVSGEMLWVVVDVRKDSNTFGQWDSTVLSVSNHTSLYVTRGFAHGCISLSDNCNLIIKSDNVYSENYGTGIIWNDKDLNINWCLQSNTPLVSESHKQYKTFKEFREKYGAICINM